MYKSMLLELCQERQWPLPRYTSMKVGPDHDPCFKASVLLNGTSFDSSVPHKSRKEAQNTAAKSAFLHFGSSSYPLAAVANQNPAQEVHFGFFKNLLQELTQKEGLSLPEYKTMKCGVPHRPTFFSSVEVDGDIYHGKGGKSKKEAEIKAAKVAYTNLTERFQVSNFELCSPQQLAGGHLKYMSTSVLFAMENEEYGEQDEVQELKAGAKVWANSTTSLDSDNSAPCSKFVPVSPKEGLQGEPLKSLPSSDFTAVEIEEHAEENEVQEVKAGGKEGSISSTSTPLDIAALSISDSNTEKDSRIRSYLLNNRFRVYPSFPDIAFSQGITVLPISEDKWVAVSLEFPND